MPYSDLPPGVVLPDTREGREDAIQYRAEGLYVAMCDRYENDPSALHSARTLYVKNPCRNREPMGDRTHNWCWRCPAGFMLWLEESGAPSDDIKHAAFRQARA